MMATLFTTPPSPTATRQSSYTVPSPPLLAAAMPQSALPEPSVLPSETVRRLAEEPAAEREGQERTALPLVYVHKDKIYGEVFITSPCAIAIIHHRSFQRLKHVLQHGITGLVGCTAAPPVTRFAHSVGAMCLVLRCGGSEEAQLAALLHDVAHTALSHVADQVHGYTVHEDDKWEFLRPSGLVEVLQKFGFDPERVLHEENFPLLELDAPALCADRVDYGLRDSEHFGLLAAATARDIYASLAPSLPSPSASEPVMSLASVSLARTFAMAYQASDAHAWANARHAYLYHLASAAIRAAFANPGPRRLGKQDWWCDGGDAEFWRKVREEGGPEAGRLAELVHPGYRLDPVPPATGESGVGELGRRLDGSEKFVTFKLKCRTLDPLVRLEGGGVKRLSELDGEFKRLREEYIGKLAKVQRYEVVRLGKADGVEG